MRDPLGMVIDEVHFCTSLTFFDPISSLPLGSIENLTENAPTTGKCLSLESDQIKNLKATYRRIQNLRI